MKENKQRRRRRRRNYTPRFPVLVLRKCNCLTCECFQQNSKRERSNPKISKTNKQKTRPTEISVSRWTRVCVKHVHICEYACRATEAKERRPWSAETPPVGEGDMQAGRGDCLGEDGDQQEGGSGHRGAVGERDE